MVGKTPREQVKTECANMANPAAFLRGHQTDVYYDPYLPRGGRFARARRLAGRAGQAWGERAQYVSDEGHL